MPDYSDDKNGKWSHLVRWVLDLFEQFSKSQYRAKLSGLITESVEAYNQEEKPSQDPWPGASNAMLPLTTISADNMEPRLVAGLVGKRPFVRFDAEEPRPPEIDELEGWFDEELADTVGIEHHAGTMIHRLLQDGTVWPMISYDLDEVTRREFILQGQEPAEAKMAFIAHQQAMMGLQQVAMGQGIDPSLMPQPEMPAEVQKYLSAQVIGGVYVGPDGQPMTQDITDKVFEGGRIELLPWDDVYWPDNVNDWESAPVIRRVMYTYAELQREKAAAGKGGKSGEGRGGWYVGNITPDLLRYKTTRLPEESQTAQQATDAVEVTGKEEIECLEAYVSYVYQTDDQREEDIDDWTEERLVVLVAKDCRTLLRLRLLRDVNYKNEHVIKRLPLFREEGRTCGIPIYAKIRSIQIAANKAFNTAFNVAEIVMIPWFLYEASTGWKTAADQKLAPGVGIPVDSVKGIMIPQFGLNPANYFQYLEVCLSFWERVLSVGDLQVGRKSDKTSTATETLAVIQEGNIIHNYRSNTLRPDFLSILKTIYDLYYQHLPFDKKWVHGGREIPITRSMMQRGKSFKLTASSEMANKLIERREKESLWTIALQDRYGINNPVEIFKEMLKSYGHEDTDRFVNPMINKVTQILQQFPQAAPLFEQAMQQAMKMAAEIKMRSEAQRKQLGAGGAGGNQGDAAVGGIPQLSPAAGAGNSGLPV